VGLLWFLPNLWSAPTLLVLQHQYGGQMISWTIPAQPGQYAAPTTGLAMPGWTISPGAPISGTRPPDWVVRFYTQGRIKPKLLCLVDVRYFPAGNDWQPYYRLDEEMFFAHKGGRWVPLTLTGGLPSLITYTPVGFANAAGYYRALNFSQTTGPITLIGWNVDQAPSTPIPAP